MATTTAPTPTIAIIGGGIIGLSTAYYLTQDPTQDANTPRPEIHIIDNAPTLFLSASGYAGGFLAKDWFSPSTASLGALSFRLHRELADRHDGRRRWGYMPSTAYSLSLDEMGVGRKSHSNRAPKRKTRTNDGENWLETGLSRVAVATTTTASANGNGNGNGAGREEVLNDDGSPAWITPQEGGSLEPIGTEDGCAQVEPRQLCECLLEEVQKHGVKIHLNTQVVGVERDTRGQVTGIKLRSKNNDNNNGDTDTYSMNCNDIVITSGAWSGRVFKTMFPESTTRIGIGPKAGYSLVVRSPRYTKPIIITDPESHSHSPPSLEHLNDKNGLSHGIFCGPGPNWSFAPEAFSRISRISRRQDDNDQGRPEIYIAGLNDPHMPLPPDVSGVKDLVDAGKLRELKDGVVALIGLTTVADDESAMPVDDLEVVREGLCLRPVTDSGRPIVARFGRGQLGGGSGGAAGLRDGSESGSGAGAGVYMAAGHGPWGISMSLGTGLVMAEMIRGRKTLSADVSELGVG